jgi:hypothetical protein
VGDRALLRAYGIVAFGSPANSALSRVIGTVRVTRPRRVYTLSLLRPRPFHQHNSGCKDTVMNGEKKVLLLS